MLELVAEELERAQASRAELLGLQLQSKRRVKENLCLAEREQ